MPFLEISSPIKDQRAQLYYEDYGQGDPIVLIHGWPLSSAMWEHQVPALVSANHRVITYDRRGFGQSSRPYKGYDYQQLGQDLKALIDHLGLDHFSLLGFSMGGGEIASYLDQFGSSQINKIIFLSSIAPYLLQTEDNPSGAPDEVFKGMEESIRTNRIDFLKGFGYGFMDYDNHKERVSEAQIEYNFVIAASASPKGTLDCIHSFGRTDFRQVLKNIDRPTLFIHGTGDQIVPILPSSEQGHALVSGSQFTRIKDAPHGLYTTHKEEVNEALLSFLKA